jgi:sugar phosphate isomerase/epimerase
MIPTRRDLLALAGATIASIGTNAARAIEPLQRNGPAQFRLSIAAYSYCKYLDLKQPRMTLDDFIDTCARLGVDAVELTAYYFPETSNDYLARLKGHCTREGLEVSGTAIGNNYCHADAAKLKSEIANAKRWIEHSSRLGAKTMRIFAGSVAREDTEEKARERCIQAIGETCDHAARFGVYVALENHGGITATIDQMLALVKAIDHRWFGVNWDSGNFHSADPYADLARLAPYAINAQVKTELRLAGAPTKSSADLPRMFEILRSAGYRGYVALEYEAAEDPRKAVPRLIQDIRRTILK